MTLLRSLAFLVLFMAAGTEAESLAGAGTRWVGTWYTAPQLVETGNNPPAPGLANNTLRQIVRISIGGDSLRMRFSNEFSTGAVIFQTVHIASSKGSGSIDTTSDRALTFGGKIDVTIPAGGSVTSDPLWFPVQPRADIAITIAYGSSPAGITGHPGSRTTSYIFTGNVVSKSDIAAVSRARTTGTTSRGSMSLRRLLRPALRSLATLSRTVVARRRTDRTDGRM